MRCYTRNARPLITLTLLCFAGQGCSDNTTSTPEVEHEIGHDVDTIVDPEVDIIVDPEIDRDFRSSDWSHITNRCAEERARPQDQIIAEPALTPPETLFVELAWQNNKPCSTQEDPRDEVDLESIYGTLAMGTHHGEPAVITTVERPPAEAHSPQAFNSARVAWVNAKDGTSLKCHDLPTQGSLAGPLHLNPWDDNAPLTVSITQDHERHVHPNSPTHQPLLDWWSEGWTMASPDLALAADFTSYAESRLLPDGQLLIIAQASRLISLDAVTGQINWTASLGQINAVLDAPTSLPRVSPGRGLGLSSEYLAWDDSERQLTVGTDNLFVYHERRVTIDHCGNIERLPNTERVAHIAIPFGEGELIIDKEVAPYKVSVRSADGESIAVMDPCSQLITLDSETVGCLRGTSITTLRWPQEERTFTIAQPDSAAPGAPTPAVVRGRAGAIALRERLLVIPFNVTNPSQPLERTYRLLFVDWETGLTMNHIDIPIPADAVGEFDSEVPVISDEGELVVSAYGYLFGIRTNTSGLSRTLLPRGLNLGNNANFNPLR